MDLNSFLPLLQGSAENFERLRRWIGRLVEEGALTQSEVESLDLDPTPSADDLFDAPIRPLVVAFFGGTGVGKSTLLNRLAGEEIAQTGIERPTSREATLYLPAQGKFKLPPGLPLSKIKTVFHHNLKHEIAWIDLPDIDSIELTNRELVFLLLPYIDVLIYVVSPERYRDLAAWSVLKERSQAAAWLFVMNHWDEACEEQIEDFKGLLKTLGFNDPIVLRCDSRPDFRARKPDDFGQLEEILRDFARTRGTEQLAWKRAQRRFLQLTDQIAALIETLEKKSKGVSHLRSRWRELWKKTVEEVSPLLAGSAAISARQIAAQGLSANWNPVLWDTWTQKHLLDALDRLALEADQPAICRELAAYRDELLKEIERQVRLGLQQSLAAPGHWLQRHLARALSVLKYLLPILLSGLAGYQLVLGYFREVYLGIDFAVHSALIIGVSGLIPHLACRLLEPSLEKAAFRGILRGLRLGFAHVETEVEQRLERVRSRLAELALEGRQLTGVVGDAARRPLLLSPPQGQPASPLLDRMLAATSGKGSLEIGTRYGGEFP
nr:hypothetical conserved protein [uncultured Gammaproteobacteria bacterium]